MQVLNCCSYCLQLSTLLIGCQEGHLVLYNMPLEQFLMFSVKTLNIPPTELDEPEKWTWSGLYTLNCPSCCKRFHKLCTVAQPSRAPKLSQCQWGSHTSLHVNLVAVNYITEHAQVKWAVVRGRWTDYRCCRCVVTGTQVPGAAARECEDSNETARRSTSNICCTVGTWVPAA